MVKILVAEDDRDLNGTVVSALVRSGYEAEPFFDGASALAALEEGDYDMVITDIMMPGMDGFALAERIRETDKTIPILFMTALDDKPSKQRGYGLGIDDYVVKPFDMDLLMLRVGALLRRANIERSRELTAGNLRMNEEEHTAYVDGEELLLTVREFDLLFKLLSFPRPHVYAAAADGRILGLRFLCHLAHGGRIHGEAARQDERLHGLRDRHRARAGV